MHYFKKYKQNLLFLAILFISNIMLQIIAPLFLSHFIDSVIERKARGYVFLCILIYLITIVIKLLISVADSYFSKAMGMKITNDYRKDVMKHFLKLDIKFHEKYKSGEMMTRLDEDVEGLFSYYYTLIYKLVGSSGIMIGVLIILVSKSIFLAIIMFLICIATITVFKLIQNYSTKLNVTKEKRIAKFNGNMKEYIDNILELQTYSATDYALFKLKNSMQQLFKKTIIANLAYARLWSASTVMEALTIFAALLIATILWNRSIITLGTVYLIYDYTKLIYGPLQQFREHMDGLQGSKAKILRVNDLFNQKSEIKEGNKELTDDRLTLSIIDLSFGYTSERDVLHGINLHLEQGERLGIIGETGCGKTTLAKLIARLYEYTEGEILLNGINMKNITEQSLRKNISYCTQQVQLIHGTLRDNINLYDNQYTDVMLYHAIDQLGLGEWFSKFHKGLDTNLELGENTLSSGETQLISIIRIFLRDSKIIILDEISSSLDHVTEEKLMRAMNILAQDKTIIVITHKLSALQWVDKIMKLDSGNVVEYGIKYD